MNTPIVDFLKGYQLEGMARFHMPGHKGKGFLGEQYDITEIEGADDLYHPTGIIAEAEATATGLFGTRKTCWGTEGSSQCVKAMLYLAVTCRREGTAPVVLAGRNVHKSFVQAAALVDFDAEWLWPEGENASLCACPITAQGLEAALSAMDTPPCAVYVTSPDYLGNMLDIRALADVAHRHDTILLVDNAHGAYLKLLRPSQHPMDLGADLCCDSAHKTLPVLTGGAYLHVGKNAPASIEDGAKEAMALFGSTSPSYLTMASLDLCNVWLAGEGPRRIRTAAQALAELKERLTAKGWPLTGDEPLKLTLDASAAGWTGPALANLLRVGGVEPEYADPDDVVLMASGGTTREDMKRLSDALSAGKPGRGARRFPPPAKAERAMSIRRAMLAPGEKVAVDAALGRVCAAPTVSCPPAVPIAMAGEVITPAAVEVMRFDGVESCRVVKK